MASKFNPGEAPTDDGESKSGKNGISFSRGSAGESDAGEVSLAPPPSSAAVEEHGLHVRGEC